MLWVVPARVAMLCCVDCNACCAHLADPYLCPCSVAKLLKSGGFELSDTEVKQLLSCFDMDDDDCIDTSEVCDAFIPVCRLCTYGYQ